MGGTKNHFAGHLPPIPCPTPGAATATVEIVFLYSVSLSHICQPQIPADESMKTAYRDTEFYTHNYVILSFMSQKSLNQMLDDKV